MKPTVLSDVRLELDLDVLRKRVRVRGASAYAEALERLVERARAVARPKALYRVGFVEPDGEDTVVVDGVVLTSRVLRVNLEGVHRVFAYAATCGRELEEWSKSLNGALERYWADEIQMMALESALGAMDEHIEAHHRPGPISSISPGSLEDWPLQQQRPLFELLGNTEDAIGVRLLDSLLMLPAKTVTGIRFPTEVGFESCRLCPRERCPGRRVPYDKDLYDRKYRATGPRGQ